MLQRAMDLYLPFLLMLVSVTSFGAAMTVVDMTYVVDENMILWPEDPPFNFTILYSEQFPEYWFVS
jgi:hypothetical protein